MMSIVKRALCNKVFHFFSIGLICFGLPFILVNNQLQGSLRSFCRVTFPFLSWNVPLLPAAELIVLAALLIRFRSLITVKRVLAASVIGVLFATSYVSSDLYLAHSIYDIQANYHYEAYALMTILFFRAFAREGRGRHILIYAAFASCMAISLADEGLQLILSDRVFDLNDNAKDALGILMGLVVVFFVFEKYGTIRFSDIPKGQKNPMVYLRDPAVALILVGLFAQILLQISALFSHPDYWWFTVSMTMVLFLLGAVVFYLTRFRVGRWAVGILLLLIVLAQGLSLLLLSDSGITYHSDWLTVCNGIPIPFADLLVYPNGVVRPTDKHHIFWGEISGFFMDYNPRIILIGAQPYGDASAIVDARRGSFLTYSRVMRRNVQIIVDEPREACRLLNELRAGGKNVIFVLHTTCGGLFH